MPQWTNTKKKKNEKFSNMNFMTRATTITRYQGT